MFQILLLLLILGVLIFVWDLFDRKGRILRENSGVSPSAQVLALRGSEYLPAKTLLSPKLGLSSRPDALIREQGKIIPVDIKPGATKVRDRHIVQLMLHMRLIEELEGERPPYGILLMGKKKREVKVKNTEEKQRWLELLIDEMRSIVDGVPAVPHPTQQKCPHCDVRERCAHRPPE